jgi:hypothetical protein
MARSKIWAAFEWASRAEVLSTIIHSEFVRNWLVPVAGTMLTGGSGILGGQPLMWAFVASSIVFMTLMLGMAASLAVRERNSPQNKLIAKAIINRDLTPRESPLLGNRKQRRAQHGLQTMLSSTQVTLGVNRTLDKVQVGIEVTNNAHFPISVILESADTEIETEKPPRSHFPKPSAICPAGTSIRIMDDAITMDEFPCQRLTGKMDMLVKYGNPGNEIFEMHVKGSLDISLEPYGQVNSISLGLV